MDAFLAEQFFVMNEETTCRLEAAPSAVLDMYPDAPDNATVYIGEICFLIVPSYRQGIQWAIDTPILKKGTLGYTIVDSCMEVCQLVLAHSLTAEAYAHPGVADFMKGLETAIWQLSLSLTHAVDLFEEVPSTSYDWFVTAERLASLRDRPFHPLAKAKIGFSEQDYKTYMAEFGNPTSLHWVAISNESIARGCREDSYSCLDLLDSTVRALLDSELERKGISTRTHTLLPVHPWQMKHQIIPYFNYEIEAGTIVVLETQAGEWSATSSVRSFARVQQSRMMLKLPISVLSLGAARYLPVVKLLNGLAGERMLRHAIACDDTLQGRVFLCEEKHWWGYLPSDMGLFDDHPRHLAAQVRMYPSELLDERYRIIPMASLGVTLNGEHLLTAINGERPTGDEAVRFYEELAAAFYDITMRLFKVGVVPEIHGQNCCVVMRDKQVAGLMLRDHDSVRLHQPYLDKHGIEDPCYHIRPGYSNSLYNETIEKLIFYIQSLGTQVNLAAIIEAMAESYDIPEKQLWSITGKQLRHAVERIDIPENDRNVLLQVLFKSKTWPSKLIIRPLLEADGVPGAMPSGKGAGYNPFRIT
ncbi:IucA/IucC family siderophore biosynthesis protein [Paenibacillus sp. PR3]|uniref:IucA/IucC family siderophore biosynthesis protein n=2 Tax=Paenibacillus terricola TaxID=2763503 RepID=A0ABR8MTH2_9BACL|nr:IucA/IucC family siderophore biosynthesis protein [Paenibacillus terricola]